MWQRWGSTSSNTSRFFTCKCMVYVLCSIHEQMISLRYREQIISLGDRDVQTMCNFLSMDPGEYSYFSPRTMKMWAGPDHWRFRPSRPKRKYLDFRAVLCRERRCCSSPEEELKQGAEAASWLHRQQSATGGSVSVITRVEEWRTGLVTLFCFLVPA